MHDKRGETKGVPRQNFPSRVLSLQRQGESLKLRAPSRSNADWVSDIAAPDRRERAIGELRAILVKGLRKYFPSNSVASNSIEDFAHEAILNIDATIWQFRGESSFESWALTIALRVAFDELRRSRFKDVSFDQLIGSGTSPNHHPPFDPVLRGLKCCLRNRIRKSLTSRQRRAVIAELRGESVSEIAFMLSTTPNNVYKLTHDARSRLRSAIQRAGWSGLDVNQVLDHSHAISS